MKDKISKFANKSALISCAVTLVFGICMFIFWFSCHPEALSYQEQNQLFLWSHDYFLADVKQPGGFADWLGEFIVQFYYVIWLGALLLAIVYMALQFTVFKSLMCISKMKSWVALLVSVLLSLLMLYLMGDENVLLSFPIAVILSLCVALLSRGWSWWLDIVIVPVLYWLVGPAAWIYVVVSLLQKRKVLQLVVPVMLLVLQIVLAYTTLEQWPMSKVFVGLNYYRSPFVDTEQFSFGYDSDKYALLKQDYQIRNERWQDIIKDAEQHQVQVNFSSEAVNLALAMTNQLAERQFSFYQSGPDALVMPMIRDNVSNLPTMEAFFRLGMVNESMRYAFDLQESILNGKKSGRLMKRLAECCIINGRYTTASKYLDLLEKSLFYRKWAKKAKSYLGNEAWINGHEVWGKIRQLRYKDDFLYNYTESDKMFGILFQTNPKNKMALEYFLAQMLLLRNIPGFGSYLGWAQQSGFYQQMPATYADAVKCVQSRGQVDGSLYADYVKRTSTQHTDGATGASQLSGAAH